jgi:glucose/arabinose dehydrogenase
VARERRYRLGVLLTSFALVLGTSWVLVVSSSPPAEAALPSGFAEVVAFSGLTQPTAVRFAPDGRVFVAEKRGTIQMFDGLGDPSPTRVADLRTEVYSWGDRGMLGLAIDPDFPTRPYLYASYAYDGAKGQTAPVYGTGTDSDNCRRSAITGPGCVASGKVVQLRLSGAGTTKKDLLHEWCLHFGSHAIDDLLFGPDGALYASSGDGASGDLVDYGQNGDPTNPCGDPPGGVGGVMIPPTAEGGALRTQDLRTLADPVGLNGTVIRISPDTGLALPDNPAASTAGENRRRIVAYGLRNPFRMAVRPGTAEVWIGDVGWRAHDEVNRLVAPTAGVRNFGWPCYEGPGRQPGYDAADLNICENLYAQPTATTAPYWSYRHGARINATDPCATDAGSSVSGLAFLGNPASPYPAQYDGALFVSDYARSCIWVMFPGTGGLPDPATLRPFVTAASVPVDLQFSPAGELFYADLVGGTIRRIVHVGTGPCPDGLFRAEYFAGRTPGGTPASVFCEDAPLAHDWGTGGPAGVGPDEFSARWTGTFAFPDAGTYAFTATSDDGVRVWVDDALVLDSWQVQTATTVTAAVPLAAGTHDVRVEYFDATGPAAASLDWAAAPVGSAPQPVIASPAAGTTWRVGDTLQFSGSASDAEDGTLPASALTWEMVLQHCPSDCHAHPQQTWTGVPGASFVAPDHETPAHLELRLTATDSDGRSTTVTRRLDPRTVPVTVASQPAGLKLTVGARTAVAPFTTSVIEGGRTGISAPSPQQLAGPTYAFTRWSDGGARSHDITAGASGTTYTATYTISACPRGQYRAQYYANATLSGAAAVTRCEAAPLDRNWGTGGPGSVGVDNFSARWNGSFSFTAGTRTFTAASDDGIRVWLDGVLIIDRWAAAGTTTATRSVTAGVHTVRVQYVERAGSASARVTW